MRISTRFTKYLAVSLVCACALAAFAAASASAAKFSPGYPIKLSGTLTFSRSGPAYPPVSCNVNETRSVAGWGDFRLYCPNGVTINLKTTITPQGSSGSYALLWWGAGYYRSPWGDETWAFTHLLGSVANGSAISPTQVIWNAPTPVGNIYNPYVEGVTMTGTLNLTTPTGGLVTIVP